MGKRSEVSVALLLIAVRENVAEKAVKSNETPGPVLLPELRPPTESEIRKWSDRFRRQHARRR